MIMELEESHDLLSANWRLGQGIILSKFKVPKTRGANGVNPNPRAKKDERCPSSKKKKKKGVCVNFSFPPC